MRVFSLLPLSAIILSVSTTVSYAHYPTTVKSVTPTLETRSHFKDELGSLTDVDDPAIWIHPSDKSRSIVVSTLKRGGLDVYNLAGELLQFIPPAPAPLCETNKDCKNKAGRTNNADIIYGFQLGNKTVDIVVVSDRGLDKLTIYTINHTEPSIAPLIDVTSTVAPLIFATSQKEINEGLTAYGLAVVKTDKSMAFVSQNATTRITQLELFDNGDGSVNYRNVANLDFPNTFTLPNNTQWTPCSDDDGELPHFEGMVADPLHNQVFFAQEDVGIWKIDLAQPSNEKSWQLIATVKEYGIPYSRTWSESEDEYICQLQTDKDPGFGSETLVSDAEGLTLYDGGDGQGYLLASSQGNNTVALFNRTGDHQFINSFTVGDGTIDGVNETDGMMVVNVNLGGKFDQGVLIMQDGQNKATNPSAQENIRKSTNFKYVAWRDIAKTLNLSVSTKDNSRL